MPGAGPVDIVGEDLLAALELSHVACLVGQSHLGGMEVPIGQGLSLHREPTLPIGLLGLAVGPVDLVLEPHVVGAEPGVGPGHPTRRADHDDHRHGSQGGLCRAPARPLQAALPCRCRAGLDRPAGEEPLEILGQGRGRWVAAGSVLLHTVKADRFQVAGDVGAQHPGGDWVVVDDLADRLGRCLTPEWRAAGQDLIQGRPQRVNVARRPDVSQAARSLLGSHVRRRADRQSAVGLIIVFLGQLRQAEVGHARDQVREILGRVRIGRSLEQDVAGLQVAVEDPPFVRVLDGPGNRRDQPGCGPCGYRMLSSPSARSRAKDPRNTPRRCRRSAPTRRPRRPGRCSGGRGPPQRGPRA